MQQPGAPSTPAAPVHLAAATSQPAAPQAHRRQTAAYLKAASAVDSNIQPCCQAFSIGSHRIFRVVKFSGNPSSPLMLSHNLLDMLSSAKDT